MDEELTDAERALLRLILTSSGKARLNHLWAAFNHVIEARLACRVLRHGLPRALREQYGIELVAIETLCSFALVEAERAGVKGLKAVEVEPAGERTQRSGDDGDEYQAAEES